MEEIIIFAIALLTTILFADNIEIYKMGLSDKRLIRMESITRVFNEKLALLFALLALYIIFHFSDGISFFKGEK